MGERGLGRLALGDVAQVGDDSFDARVFEQVGPGHLEPTPRPMRVANPGLERPRATRLGQHVEEEATGLRKVLGVKGVLVDALAHDLVGLPTHHALAAGAHIGDGAFGVGHEDDVGGVLHQRPEALLAASEAGLGTLDLCRLRPQKADDEHQAQSGKGAEAVDERLRHHCRGQVEGDRQLPGRHDDTAPHHARHDRR